MKKKIAMLLASVMTLSTMSINVFGATNNYVSKTPTNVTNATLMLEEGWVYEYTKSADQQFVYATPQEQAQGYANTVRVSNAATGTTGNRYDASGTTASIAAQVPGPMSGTLHHDANYVVDGPSLKLSVNDRVYVGDTFKIELTNARWRFWNVGYGANAGVGTKVENTASVPKVVATDPTTRINYLLGRGAIGGADVTSSAGVLNAQINFALTNSSTAARIINNGTEIKPLPTSLPTAGSTSMPQALPKSSYDINKGIFVPSTTTGASATISNTVVGTYYRYGGLISPDLNANGVPTSTAKYVPYALYVTYTNVSVAIVTILEDALPGDQIVIPVVAQTTGADDIRATIIEGVGNFGSVSSGTYLVAVSGTNSASTTASISGTTPNSSGTTMTRDEFILNDLVIRENRISSVKNGSFSLTLPTGFHFYDPANGGIGKVVDPTVVTGNASNVCIGLESGLAWGAFGTRVAGQTGFVGYKGSILRSEFTSTNFLNGKALTLTDNIAAQTVYNGDYGMSYYWNGFNYEDNRIVVSLNNISQSKNLAGAVIVRGLRVYADENAPMDTDVILTVTNHDAGISTGTVNLGKRSNYSTSFSIGTPVPKLINGRYSRNAVNGVLVGMLFADDATHKTARVTYSETTASSWWSGRSTTFTLSAGAKFRKVKIVDRTNLQTWDALNAEYYAGHSELLKAGISGAGSGTYLNDGILHGHVTINGGAMTITNLQPTVNGTTNIPNRAGVVFDTWVSVQSGLEAANITLTASGSAVEKSVTSGAIATQTSPITVKSTVSPLRIGLQYQNAGNIVITETQAGALQAGKEVIVTITDFIDTSVLIAPTAEVSMGEGSDLKVSTASFIQGSITQNSTTGAYTSSLFGTTANSNYGGSIKLTVERASSKASSIIISNVQVRVDRTVPETQKPYKVLVWGSAVAENFGQERDQFTVPGISADYISIVTSASNPGVINTQVQVPIGETYYIVNNEQFDMDVAAYVSEASNSTMVPVRFVCNALGIADDQIIYDNDTKTVTIIHPDRVVQFTTGSDRMKLNGAETIMRSPDSLPVKAEVKDDRMFIPFRALGEAFGMEVSWKADPPTAVYTSMVSK